MLLDIELIATSIFNYNNLFNRSVGVISHIQNDDISKKPLDVSFDLKLLR